MSESREDVPDIKHELSARDLHLGKECIEHHGFYRCQKVRKIPRHKTRIVSKGSLFR